MILRPVLASVWVLLLCSAVIAGAQSGTSASPSQSGGDANITGTLTDPTGAGVAGASVTVDNGAGSAQNAVTDNQGQYSFHGLPGGLYTISAVAGSIKLLQASVVVSPGQAVTLGAAGLTATPSSNPPSAQSSTAPTEAVAQSADTKAAITGTVSGPKGVGLAGATVEVSNGSGYSQQVITDAQGLYAATDLPGGSYSIFVVDKGAKVFQAAATIGAGQLLMLGVAGALVAQSINLPAPAVSQASAAAAATGQAATTNTVEPAQTYSPLFPSEPVMPVLVGADGNQIEGVTQGKSVARVGGGGGTISGTVSDATGAVLANATVTLNKSTGLAATAVTDDQGAYAFREVPAGAYTVAVTAPGFKKFEAANINLAQGTELPLDATLEPAGAQTEVNVQSQNASQVETETASVSGTLTQKEVTTLGLNGRNFTQLIALTPGVSNQTGQDEAKVGVVGSVKYSVNGGRVEYNTFEVDGSDVLNAGLNGAESTLVVYPSLDAIQEVKVLTSNYGAMYGRTASGTVLVTTKTGGAQWHGNGYEFIRNEAFNARNYFDQTTKAPLYRRNDFGFTLGGPIKKDKTFIFWSEEFRIEKSPSDQHPNFNHGVPSLAERQGDFSDVCPGPTDPTLLAVGGFLRSKWPDCPSTGGQNISGYEVPFLNNNIFTGGQPGGGEDLNAAAILSTNLIPLPNSSTGCNSSIGSCYNIVISEPTHWREELVNLDHQLTSKLRLTLRGIHDSWDTVVPVPQWPLNNIANSFPTVQNKFVGPGVSFVAHLTDTIKPTLLNELEASFINSDITLQNVNGPGGATFQRPAGLGTPGGTCPFALGIPQPNLPNFPVLDCPMGAIFNNGFKNYVPGLVIGGTNQEYGGSGFVVDPSYSPFRHTNPTFSYRDNLSMSIGKHTLQVGVQLIFAQRTETNGAIGAASGDVQGLLTFSNINGGQATTGNAFANFLRFKGTNLGSVSSTYNAIQSYTQDSTQRTYYNRYRIAEPYVQDDWKVNSRLSLNLGVRFSLFGLWNEKYHTAYNWTPSAYSPALAAQIQVNPSNGQLLDSQGVPIPIDLNNPDPRITNGIVQCGVQGVPNGCMKGRLFNPAPRVGLAWDPRGDGKTSIRAGYGMFFEHGTGEEANTGSLEASAPLVLSMTQRFPLNYGCIGSSSFTMDPFCTRNSSGPGAYPLSVTGIPTKAVWPYSQQWSLSVQRELTSSLVATVAYVGSRGIHLTAERQLNQLKPVVGNENPFGPNQPLIAEIPNSNSTLGDCGGFAPDGFHLLNGTFVSPQSPAYTNLVAACAGANDIRNPTPDVNTVRPYPGLDQIFSLQNVARSSYHSFQTTLRRTRGPFTIGGSYSYSHSIDNSSDRSDATFVNSYDLQSNKASSNFDQRHLLNISYIYDLPNLSTTLSGLGSGHAGDSTEDDVPLPASPSRFLRVLGDGWQVSGITVFQSGTPFSVINGGSGSVSVLDNAGVANGEGVGAGSYPDLAIHPGPAPDERLNSRSFGPLLGNPNMFVAPRGLTFGNAGRNFLNNPHRTNFDLSLLKHFKVTESKVLEFRAEAFNIFNHTQFRIYNPDLGNTGSNKISCYGGPNYTAGFAGEVVNGVTQGTDCVTGSAFLHPVDAHRPRTLQFGLKFSF